MTNFQPKTGVRNYLLIPAMPTPNGRIHLGHIAGPFLKMDVLGRHLQRRGDNACLISTTDPHDSFVLLKAYETHQAPEAVANHFHEMILNDLRSLDINPAAFCNPLQAEWSASYTSFNVDTVKALIQAGRTEVVRERFLYCPRSARYIAGCWLLGRCPGCASNAGSYSCEECGMHFRPEMLREPHSRLDEGPLEVREVRCLFLKLSATNLLFSRLLKMGVPEEFQDIVRRHVATQGGSIRLTQPGQWGVPWTVVGERAPQVIFTPAIAIIALWLLCGKAYGELVGTGVNAFSEKSDVTTVSSFGIDNVLPFLLSGLGANLELATYRAPDHFLINHFYSLEGEKFSTSRGHVIWAGDIANNTIVSSDAVRGYLARVNPDNSAANFDLSEFVKFANDILVDRFQAAIDDSWAALRGRTNQAPSARLLEHLHELLDTQALKLDPLHFDLAAAWSAVELWLEGRPTSPHDDDYWWAKGLALLAYPFLPKLGMTLWQALGHEARPTIDHFLRLSTPRSGYLRPSFRHLEVSDLHSCLPATMKGEVLHCTDRF